MVWVNDTHTVRGSLLFFLGRNFGRQTRSTVSPNGLFDLHFSGTTNAGSSKRRFLTFGSIIGQQRMLRFQPTTTPEWCKFENGMHRYFNVHTVLNGCRTKVRD